MPIQNIYSFLEFLLIKYPSRYIPRDKFYAELCNYFDILSEPAIKNKFDFIFRQQLIHAGKKGWIIDYEKKRNRINK